MTSLHQRVVQVHIPLASAASGGKLVDRGLLVIDCTGFSYASLKLAKKALGEMGPMKYL